MIEEIGGFLGGAGLEYFRNKNSAPIWKVSCYSFIVGFLVFFGILFFTQEASREVFNRLLVGSFFAGCASSIIMALFVYFARRYDKNKK